MRTAPACKEVLARMQILARNTVLRFERSEQLALTWSWNFTCKEFQGLGVCMQIPLVKAVCALLDSHELQLLRDAVEDEGVEIRTAVTPGQAAESGCPVIVCDTDLHGPAAPLMPRFQARSEARVILLSRVADNEMWISTLDLGAFDLLSKSCSPKEMRAAVIDALFSGPVALTPSVQQLGCRS